MPIYPLNRFMVKIFRGRRTAGRDSRKHCSKARITKPKTLIYNSTGSGNPQRLISQPRGLREEASHYVDCNLNDIYQVKEITEEFRSELSAAEYDWLWLELPDANLSPPGPPSPSCASALISCTKTIFSRTLLATLDRTGFISHTLGQQHKGDEKT